MSTTNVNIDVNNIKVWGALELFNSKFGANFVIRGRTITIGTAGIAVGNIFKYGRGNGLYEINVQPMRINRLLRDCVHTVVQEICLTGIIISSQTVLLPIICRITWPWKI